MEKLSKQTFKLLCFINSYKQCTVSAALSNFDADAAVTKTRIDELLKAGFIQKHRGIFLIVTPTGRKLIADTADNLATESEFFKLNLNKEIIIAIVSAIFGALIQKVLDSF